MDQHNVIFVGGPGSGKSNFLFRIWIALERETGKLLKDGLPDDLGYLHDGAALLLDGKFAPHTSIDTQHTSNIPVKWQGTSETGALVMPDASGELWLELYKRRAWPKAWDDSVNPDVGIVMMICAGSPHNVHALDWITCEHFYGAKRQNLPTSTPTQVMLVDWLQILHAIADKKVGRRSNPRLSIVVSAWDRVVAEGTAADARDYLETQFPLLGQFVASGNHGFDVKLFGLSIFGDDPDKSPDIRRQIQITDAAMLGYVVHGDAEAKRRSSDVLEPIYWALGKDV